MEAMLAGMLGGQGAAGGPDGGAEAAPGGAEGQPSMEDLMALLQMYENNPEDAPPELGELLKAVRQQKGEATAADKVAEGQDIVPEPGFVIKTADDKGNKVFINICGSDKVAPPGAKWEEGKVPEAVQRALDQGDDADADAQQALRCPISLGEPRVDMDRKGEACTVYDCVFNDEVCATATKAHRQLKNFIIELALGWVQHKHKLVLDPKYKLPRMRYKGEHVASMRIRVDKKALVTEVEDTVEEDPVFPLVTKPIPATAARPPKGATAPAGSGAGPSGSGSGSSSGGSGSGVGAASAPAALGSAPTGDALVEALAGGSGAGRLQHSLEFVGAPAEAVRLTVRTPEGGPPLDVGSVALEVAADQLFVEAPGYATLAVKTPFFVTHEGGDVLLDAAKGELLVFLPFRPFESVLEQMRKEAPHKFGELGLSNESYLQLEP
eukprot:jgi/Tetstr1/436102/TSEL_024950.t1